MGEVGLLPVRTSPTLHPHALPLCNYPFTLILTLTGARAIIKVSGRQHWWLAGGYDLRNWTFLEVDSMVVRWWIVFFVQWIGGKGVGCHFMASLCETKNPVLTLFLLQTRQLAHEKPWEITDVELKKWSTICCGTDLFQMICVHLKICCCSCCWNGQFEI